LVFSCPASSRTDKKHKAYLDVKVNIARAFSHHILKCRRRREVRGRQAQDLEPRAHLGRIDQTLDPCIERIGLFRMLFGEMIEPRFCAEREQEPALRDGTMGGKPGGV